MTLRSVQSDRGSVQSDRGSIQSDRGSIQSDSWRTKSLLQGVQSKSQRTLGAQVTWE
jgi:hypothetical protein